MIGVFDSGSGGLTVMRALEQALPTESFIYLGDHGNAPYGNRSPADIYDLTLRGIERLFGLGCSLVIIACNTAAATGLRQLQQTWLPHAYPQHRVIGIIVPMIEAITGMPWEAQATAATPIDFTLADPALHVAVCATRHTVNSGAYVTEIAKRAPAIRVSQQACPELAGMIDDGASDDEIRPFVGAYVGELLAPPRDSPDVCILACTHYPLIEHLFREVLPPRIPLLTQGEVTAASLQHYLARHPRFSSVGAAATVYLTTGDPEHVSTVAGRFYGRVVQFQAIA
ncbi:MULTISPECIES: glutamate racemase [unclassified Achromobacter]|uniref:glutamate racemase n=1 Tax=unclassified Achromobacter TaxID=2626865 RepID=UPI000B516491|nr:MULTISPECIES: aspartate/glutamate racemase family protein [unclassified Achromobacter]OWT75003.1 glutamate racemase [Achromobacter sp. HZ28]OWT76612.1 glutamate racemase [Achromobacter sp. HZ34]